MARSGVVRRGPARESKMNLKKIPVLVLNSSYEPITVVTARRALTQIIKGVAVPEVMTSTLVHNCFYLPTVIRMREFKKFPHRRPQATRKNIFRRDGGKCMYCGRMAPKVTLELEHIIPKSRGGTSAWENLVASCRECNQKKGDRLPEEANMKLIRRPLPISIHTNKYLLREIGASVPEWKEYLWHDSDGDRRYQYA